MPTTIGTYTYVLRFINVCWIQNLFSVEISHYSACPFQISKSSSRWINPINPVNISLSLLRSRYYSCSIHISRNESPSQLWARSSATSIDLYNCNVWNEKYLKPLPKMFLGIFPTNLETFNFFSTIFIIN